MGGILRQDLAARSSEAWGWEGNHDKESFSLPSSWEGVRGRLLTSSSKATTTSGCLNDGQQPAGLGDHWSCPQHWQESTYDMVAHMLPPGSGGPPRTGEGRFLSRNYWQCSRKEPPQLLELVLLLNWLLSVAKCLLCWPEYDKISLMRIY